MEERIDIQKAMNQYLDEKKAKAFFNTRDILKTKNGDIFIKSSASDKDNHTHWYAIDQDGNGLTLTEWDSPYFQGEALEHETHTHEVKNWLISASKGHDHYFDFRNMQQQRIGDEVIEDPRNAEGDDGFTGPAEK